MRVQAKLKIGFASQVKVGLSARRSGAQFYAFAQIARNFSIPGCVFELGDVAGGTPTLKDSLVVPIGDCPASQFVKMTLDVVGPSMYATYNGYTPSAAASTSVTGLGAGTFTS